MLAALGFATPVRAQTFKVGSFTKQVGTTVTVQNAANVKATAASTVQFGSFDPGSSANRVLVVGLTLDGWGTPATGLTVTYGGAPLTLVAGTSVTGGTLHGEIWYLPNPPSTPASLVASWLGGARNATMGVVAFNNADQTTPVRNGNNLTNTTAAISSLPITSAVNDMTLDSVANQCGTAPYLSAPTKTMQWLDQSATGQKAGGSTAVGAATVTHAWTNQAACRWISSGVDIKVAPVVTAQPIAHGLGQTPSAIMLWTSGSTASSVFQNSDWSSFGMSDGTTSYSVARSSQTGVTTPNTSRGSALKAITIVQYGQVLQAEADLTWDATKFTLTWTTNNASAYVIHYLVIGGVSAKLVSWTPTAGLGVKAIGGVGFRPTVVFHMEDSDSAALPSSIAGGAFSLGVMDSNSQQWVTAVNSLDSGVVANSDTARLQRTDSCIVEINSTGTEQTRAAFSSMDTLGFSVNYALNGAQNKMYSLALAGLNVTAGNFDKIRGSVAAPAFVAGQQNAINVLGAGRTTNARAFPAATTAGNLIIATVSFDAATVLVPTVSDNVGNTYTLAVGPTNWGPNYHTYTYYASNIAGGATTVTAALPGPGTASFFELYIFEYSGATTLDKVSAAIGPGNSSVWNSGAQTTTHPNELVYGYGAGGSGVGVKGATYTARSTYDSNIAEDKTVAALGTSVSADGTFPGNTVWVAQMAIFKGGQQVTSLGFQPSAVLLASVMDITRAAPNAQARLGIGATDSETEGATAIQDADAVATTRGRNLDKTDKLFVKVNNNTNTIDAEADLKSIDADGFSLDWTTNDAVATEMLYVAFAPFVATEVRLTSFTAAKYDRGVLLEWRTGYEIDNLGFNVYREINGVRTKVNTLLIAGSGLQAGRNAGQSYARWDVNTAASDPAVTYWLEDVEFNGLSTWHGPYTPLVGELTEPVVDSPELNDSGPANSRRIFFNYNEDPARPGPRVVPAQVAPEVMSQWGLASEATVKLGIRKPGWYRVTQPELVAAGLAETVDPTTLRLFVDGIEQAIRVTGPTATSFDAIEFYASGTDTPYTDTRIYWLQAGIQPGRRITNGAVGTAPSPTSTGFPSTLKRKDRTQYAGGIRNGDIENWFGPTVSPAVPTALTLTPSHLDGSAAGSAQLSVALQGLTSTSDGSANHVVGVLVNGSEVGEMTFTGEAHAEQTFDVVVINGENTVTLEARGGDATRDTSVVDVIKLNYPHTYDADADRLRFTVEAPVSITIGGFASRSIRVVDITDRAAPVELAGGVGDAVNGVSPVTVYVAGQGQRTLLAFSDETIASPAFIQANLPSTLHASANAYDYVVVSHADFIAQVAPLVAHRHAQGRRAVAVDIEDVYDEFSFGEKTPQALKDFLRWARTNWTIGPRFVVLAGDATTDPRDYEGLGNSDFVPTRQVAMAFAATETASDDWFVDFDDDGLAEIPIGRLSVRTADQATTVVAKIVSYDDESSHGPWTKHVLLVADQNDAHSNFERLSDTLGATMTADYAVQRVFRGAAGNDAARTALTDRVNDGQLIVNYTGHGNVHFWGGDVPLLQNAVEDQPVDDVRTLWHNAARLPLVVAMNCLNGQFDGIWDEESLAETLQRAPVGGAVAVWTSSSLTPASTQAIVNQALFRLIFGGTYATLGEAVAAAKRSVSSLDLRRSLIFFGDPAMRLSGVPQAPLTSTFAMTSVSITADKASPQLAATTMTFTAHGAGGMTPYSFKFLVTTNNWVSSTTLRDWSTTPTAQWTPSALGSYQVGVWARGAGNMADTPEVSAAPIAFAIAPPVTLTVSVQGSGTVTTGDGLIKCPSVGCSHVYASGTTVTLQTVPLTGFAFAGWSSSACSSGTVLMATDLSCGATFLQAVGGPKPGSINLNGSGFGDVFTYDPLTGVHTSQASDGQMHFSETRGQWAANWQVYPADFNGDGLTDFFLHNATTGQWFKAINNGAGDFSYFTGRWNAGWQVFIVDLNGDHHSDVFLSNPATGDWFRAVSTGAGTGDFAYGAGHWITGWQIYPAELNGDGVTDFFLYNPSSGNWYQVINDGVAGFRYTAGAWSTGWSITPGDFNGDGRTDFFLSRPATGEWYVATTLMLSGFAYRNGQWVVGWTFTPGDFNADGKTDLLLYNPTSGAWFEAFSDGAGGFTFASGSWIANWQVQVTDLNGDGWSDVLLYNPASGQWFQAVNAGGGTFNYGTGLWEPGLVVIGSTPRIP